MKLSGFTHVYLFLTTMHAKISKWVVLWYHVYAEQKGNPYIPFWGNFIYFKTNKKYGVQVIRLQRSGIDTIKYHTWPRIPMGKWQTHRRHHKRKPRGQPFPSRWPQSTCKQTHTKHSKHKTEQKHKRYLAQQQHMYDTCRVYWKWLHQEFSSVLWTIQRQSQPILKSNNKPVKGFPYFCICV